MRRREMLLGAGPLIVGAAGFPSPAIAQGHRRFRLVTDWPEDSGMFASASRLARTIGEASGGRIQIDAYPANALVRPLETVDAVQSGIAEMYHTHEGFYETKSLAFHFFSGLPFGLTANELFAWVRFGGGRALWDELGSQFGIKSLHCSSTGPQMGGWFRQEIASLESFRGLRYRMAEPGARVLRELGAVVVALPGSEIPSALKSGAIDAGEYVGPWEDMRAGLHEVAPYYYYPGWNEPSAVLTLGIAEKIWNDLADADRRLIEIAAAGEYAVALAEFNSNNALALRRLRDTDNVAIKRFNPETLAGLKVVSDEMVVGLGAGDDLSRRILASYRSFQDTIRDWSIISEGAYLATGL